MTYTTYLIRKTPALSSSARKVPILGSLCMAGQRGGICVGMPDEAGSVCQTVRLTRIVAGLSQ